MKWFFTAFILLVLSKLSYAEADGTDFYQVSGAESAQMYEENAISSKLVLLIPPGTNGLRNLGCSGAPSFTDWQKMTAQEQMLARNNTWCNVSVNGREGWVQSHYLAEGNAIVDQPTFDCTAPHPHEIEILVCGDTELILLDIKMSQVYQAAVQAAGELGAGAREEVKRLKAMQRGWIKGRNECWKALDDKKACAVKEYQHRITLLESKWNLVNGN